MKFAFSERLRAWLPLFIPLLFLAATYWLNQQVMPTAHKADASSRHDIDFSIDNVTATTLNEAGQPRSVLSASKMWHFPDDQISHLENPLLTTTNIDGSKVITTALNGIIINNGDEVVLDNTVKIVRANAQMQTVMTLQTEHLQVFPKLETAQTQSAVILTTAQDNIQATGMETNFKTRITKLLANVKAVHAPVIR